MGKYNSSIYRVRPLMDIIKIDYAAFQKLMHLVGITGLSKPQKYYYDGGADCKEKQLKPSRKHLEKLIIYMATKDFTGVNEKNKKRSKLYFTDPRELQSRNIAKIEALAELSRDYERLTPSSRKWYVFEGFTNPDIFIEGEDYVIVCEGKWTEPHITVQTTNLKTGNGEYRNQMLRHIQGALNYTSKKVYAFYIVDKVYGKDYLEELTCESFKKQLELETIKICDEKEREKIIKAFCGYTTWQDIQENIAGILFKRKEDIL